MKKWKLSVMGGALTLAAVAANIQGDFNTWLGHLAGKDATGNRTTLQGAGAGAESYGMVRTSLFGAAAGMRSDGLDDCVAIGFGAMMNCTNMSGVVAIGRNALAGRSSESNTTYINGHFYASAKENALSIGTGRGSPVITFQDGVLEFPGARQVVLDVTVTNAAEAGYASHAGTAIYADSAQTAVSASSAGSALYLGENDGMSVTYTAAGLSAVISNLTARIVALETAAN